MFPLHLHIHLLRQYCKKFLKKIKSLFKKNKKTHLLTKAYTLHWFLRTDLIDNIAYRWTDIAKYNLQIVFADA